MTWVKLDDHFDEHPKIAALSDTALALWVASLAYCNRNLTDGFIPFAIGHGKLRYCDGNPVPSIHELEQSGLWEEDEIRRGWIIHDYGEYQPTKEDVLAERAYKQAAGQAGGQASAQARAQARAQAGAQAGAQAERQAESKPVPVPEPVPEPVPQEPSEAFVRFWSAFPRKVGKRTAALAFRRAEGRASAEVIIAAAQRLAEDPNLPEERFVPHPTTWLNRDGWEDEPLPTQGGTSKSAKLLALADRLEEG
jgi:hypothetical protein